MNTYELVLRWAEILLQGQILAFIFACLAVFLWRNQIGRLIDAIAKRGGKFSAGPVSGEIAAGAEEGTTPIQEEIQESSESLPSEDQARVLERLALRFEDVALKGPVKRSEFVEELRSRHHTGWSWEFLRTSLGQRRVSVRFCAASVLPSAVREFDPQVVANLIAHDSSSLVRFRLVEALLYWTTSSVATDELRSSVRFIVSEHIDENQHVDRAVQRLLGTLERQGHTR